MHHPWRTPRTIGLLLTLALVATVPAAADTDLWLHVRVDGRHGETVSVNLPLSLVEAALPMIPAEHFRDGRLVIDDHHWDSGHDLSIADLRTIWQELKSSPDMTFVTVEDRDELVKVAKNGAYLLVDIEDDGRESAQVRMPMTVVDALLSGEGNELDIRAAIDALVAHGEGELVTVSEEDEQVRVWVDRSPEAE